MNQPTSFLQAAAFFQASKLRTFVKFSISFDCFYFIYGENGNGWVKHWASLAGDLKENWKESINCI